MSDFKAVPGLCYELDSDVLEDSTTMELTGASKLLDCLEGMHTYLILSNGVDCEYVKVTVEDGVFVLLERGVDWTDPGKFFKGAKVTFDWIGPAMEDFLACMEEDEDEEDCPPKIPGMVAVKDPETGKWCYEQEQSDICWTSGKYKFTFKNGIITREARATNLSPGCYENAKVTLNDDCEIVSIEEGNKPLYTPGVKEDCC
jgi:hypothetical protein